MCFLHFPTTYPWYAGPPFSGPGVLEVEETLEFLKLESRSRIDCYFITTCSALRGIPIMAYPYFFVLKKKPRFLIEPRKLFPKRQLKILQS